MNTYPQEYIDYLVYFHADRDFFECHEILEEYWKKESDSPYRDTWQGFIQVAVAMYHQRRDNRVGADKMLSSAIALFNSSQLMELGIDAPAFMSILKERLNQYKEEYIPYMDIDIPIVNEKLLQLCIKRSLERGVAWGQASNLNNSSLIHKHSLRDRTAVIEERLHQKAMRKQGKRT